MRLLVVGEPGSGKTSWCREYIDEQRKRGATVGGIVCPAIQQQGQRVGSNALDLLTGQAVPFARLSRHESLKAGEKIGDYTISKDGILYARGAIKRAIDNGCDLVVIDEVGPLELSGKGLMPAVESALGSAANLLIVVRSSLREALQKRFPEYAFMVVADLTQSASKGIELANGRSGEVAACESRTEGRQTQDTE